MKPLSGPHEGEPNAYGPTYWYSASDGNLVIEEGASGGWRVAVYMNGSAKKNYVLFSRVRGQSGAGFTGEVRIVKRDGTPFQSLQAAMDAIAAMMA